MLGWVCSQIMAKGDGREAITQSSPHAHLLRFLSAPHCWFLPQFPRTDFPIHTRERKLVFPVSLFPSGVCKALREQNCQIPQVISVITLDPYVPWARCPPWDQQPSLPFPGRDYVAYKKTKLLTLFLKSLNNPQSQFLIYSWMNLKEQSHLCKIQEYDWEHNSKASSSVLLVSLLHNPLLPLWAQWRWVTTFCIQANIYKWFFSHAFMYVN